MTFNAELVNDLAQGRVALFVGAGASKSATNSSGKRLPLWDDFLRQQAQKIPDGEGVKVVEHLLDRKDYLMACEVLAKELDESWATALSREFGLALRPSALHKALISLGQSLVITTNFDKLIEACWEKAAQDSGANSPKVLHGVGDEAFRCFRDPHPYLIKLHGSIDDIGTLVFTKREFINKAFGSWQYQEFMQTVLQTYTVLFVGCSMDDPAISGLLEGHARKFPGCRPHYIFQSTSVSQRLIDLTKSLRRIYPIPYSPANNHAELPRKVKALALAVEERRKEIKARA